jgi:hypothetical protein
MHSITVRNVNHALPIALLNLREQGKRIAPRGKATIEMPDVFSTTYLNPEEMILFDSTRDANPFFHFFESLWILAGRQDVAFLAHFLPRMADFSDNGKTFHAPYGYRMRINFGVDQIEQAVIKLIEQPDTRQVVMSIWDPKRDWETTKDYPCNDMVMFKVRDNMLRMTVCNRSNDAILGAYGANVVQFSMLQRYIAGRVGVNIGSYTQISDSFHVYEDNPYWQAWNELNPIGMGPIMDPYSEMQAVKPNHYMTPVELMRGEFDEDLETFFKLWDEEDTQQSGAHPEALNPNNYDSTSFKFTVLPMYRTFLAWRAAERAAALDHGDGILADDWRLAVKRWMLRRTAKALGVQT